MTSEQLYIALLREAAEVDGAASVMWYTNTLGIDKYEVTPDLTRSVLAAMESDGMMESEIQHGTTGIRFQVWRITLRGHLALATGWKPGSETFVPSPSTVEALRAQFRTSG